MTGPAQHKTMRAAGGADAFSDLTPEELGASAVPGINAEPAGEEVAVDFLEKLRPGGPWTLTAIVPDGDTTTITARTASEVRGFVRANNGKSNIHYTANKTRTAMTRKPKKGHISAVRFVHADLDPRDGETPAEAKARILAQLKKSGLPPPTAIVDSGNGLQMIWRLEQPVILGEPAERIDEKGEPQLVFLGEDQVKVADVEARSKAVMEKLGCKAGTQNIDRLLRLPGTTNLPNAAKKRKGRVPCQAKLLTFSDAAYPLDAFPTSAQQAPGRGKAAAKPNTRQGQEPRIDFGNLPDVDIAALPVSDDIKKAIDTDGGELGDGDRSKAVFRVTCELVRAGCSDQQIASVLWSKPIGAHCHDQPDPERAISRAISRARQKADAANEFDLVESGRVEGTENPSRLDKWGDPADLWEEHTEGPPTLPPDVVPNLVWQFAEDRARRLGVEPGAPAAALITALGSLVPAGSVIQPRQRDTQWAVKPILWTMIIGAPGSNKSAVLSQAMTPIRDLEHEWRTEFQRAKNRYPAAQEFSSGSRRKNPDTRAVLEEEPTVAPPYCRRKIANDATTEALAELLSKNHDGLLLFAEELAGLFGSMDAYRQRSGKDRPFWLQAKDGGPITVDRKSHGSIHAPNCAVSVLGSIQPDKLFTLAPSLTDDGLLQRFAPIFIERRSNGEDLEPDEALDHLVSQTARSIAANPAERFRLSPKADVEFQATLRFKDDALHRAGANPAFGQWLDKIPNEFARIALIFQHIEWHSSEAAALIGDFPPPELISAETARRARRYLTEFIYGHARALYCRVPDDALADKHAQWIAEFILARELESIDERTVYRSYAALRPRDRRGGIPAVMRNLELLDWVRPTAWRASGQAKCWSVNPAVHDGRFADRAVAERSRRIEIREKISAENTMCAPSE